MITIKSKSSFADSVGARSIFIDDIALNKTLELEFIFENGAQEKHTVVSGSKFSSPDATIDKVVFYNDSSADIDLAYHSSRFLIYDEAKVIGDVKALTRFDNLTVDGNRFFSGNGLGSAVDAYTQLAFYNPIGSGITTYLDILRINALGNVVVLLSINEIDVALFDAVQSVANKRIGNSPGKTQKLIGFSNSAQIGTKISTSIGTDLYGTPAPLDLNNSPIELIEGVGLNFVPNDVNNGLTLFAEMWEE